MQPLTKALRRRLRRLAPELSERDIDRFEHERRAAMQAALLQDPLYAEALGPGPESRGPEAMTAAPPSEAHVVRQLGSLLLRAAEVERRSLDRKADRALARQAEAARPKRLLAPRAAAKKAAPSKPATKKTAPKKAAQKRARKMGKKAARRPVSRSPSRIR